MKRVSVYRVELVKEKGGLYDVDTVVKSPAAAARLVNEVLGLNKLPREHLVLGCFDVKLKCIGLHVIHIGTIDSSIVALRDVFQHALLNNANQIMLFHNHPSGNAYPSREDVAVTHRTIEASKILGINFLDHIIVADDTFTSLRERGDI